MPRHGDKKKKKPQRSSTRAKFEEGLKALMAAEIERMSQVDMSVKLGPLHLDGPLVLASGTWGYWREGRPYAVPLSIGAVCLKGVTMEPRAGNPPPRVHPVPGGMLNSVGLENVGIRELIDKKLPEIKNDRILRFVNFAGDSVEQFGEMAWMLSGAAGVDALEVNVSCPNVKAGGKSFGSDPVLVAEIIKAVRGEAPKLPIFAKLSPDVTDIVPIAEAAMSAGATGLTIANCHRGLAIDVATRRPIFRNIVAGMSGSAIMPLTLRLVWEVHRAMPKVPIIGLGGVSTGDDAAQYFLAGASAVGIGAINILNPHAAVNISEGLRDICKSQGVKRLSELTGALRDWIPLKDRDE